MECAGPRRGLAVGLDLDLVETSAWDGGHCPRPDAVARDRIRSDSIIMQRNGRHRLELEFVTRCSLDVDTTNRAAILEQGGAHEHRLPPVVGAIGDQAM